jgi:hypothetical protein
MFRTLLLVPILLAALVGAHDIARRADADSTVYDAGKPASVQDWEEP